MAKPRTRSRQNIRPPENRCGKQVGVPPKGDARVLFRPAPPRHLQKPPPTRKTRALRSNTPYTTLEAV
ncbi:hypothetical protein [Kingella potus]|uniref:hypothetical protein n=1 Tax=Kingella potus TaxID=265175 RepID=UPI001FD5DDB9|nr:hypothetical protein [Kingella potus]UOP01479.1 hypothetical protein LVJ84_04610 [Kingella potus]